MKNKGIRIGLVCLGLAVIGVILFLIFQPLQSDKTEKEKIGFVMSGSIGEEGWNGMHYKGMKSACDTLEMTLLVKENVGEFTGECKSAIKELVEDGAKMIILSSYGYSEEVKDLVKEYPEISFYVNSSEYHEKNMTSYFVRMYQVRYLSGIIAGMQTETNTIGYVAAMANNEVNRGISAFTLGVKRANPDAEVVVAWTDSWDDEKKEKEAAKKLIEKEKADVVTYHQNQQYVLDVADEAGVKSIGYHQAYDEYSEKYLTSVVCNWDRTYRELIREFLQGRSNINENTWLGLEESVVDLSEYSKSVTEEEKEAVEIAKQEILSGNDVFSGELYDNVGELRCRDGESISDTVLLEQFDWYVEGVRFYED